MAMHTGRGVLRGTAVLMGRMLGFYRPWAGIYLPGVLAWASQDFVATYIFATVQRDLLAAVMAGPAPSILTAVALFLARQGGFLIVFSLGSLCMLLVQQKVKGQFQAALFAKLVRRQTQHPAATACPVCRSMRARRWTAHPGA